MAFVLPGLLCGLVAVLPLRMEVLLLFISFEIGETEEDTLFGHFYLDKQLILFPQVIFALYRIYFFVMEFLQSPLSYDLAVRKG